MKPVILLKAHVHGHFKNGVWVEPYETKTPSASPFKGEGHASKHWPKGWGDYKPKPKPKPEGYHPKAGDDGERIAIERLSKPTGPEAFSKPEEIATVLPGGHLPAELHGVPLAPWHDAPRTIEEWEQVEGQALIDEPPFEATEGKKVGAGVIVQEPDGRIWVIHPTNRFGGYKGTFPKGTVEDGLGLHASAIKEAFEESGLKVEITGFLMDVERTTSKARFYTAKRVGGTPADCGWESQAVSLVPVDKLYTALNMYPDHALAEKLGAGPPPPKPKYTGKPSSGPTSDPTQGKLL